MSTLPRTPPVTSVAYNNILVNGKFAEVQVEYKDLTFTQQIGLVDNTVFKPVKALEYNTESEWQFGSPFFKKFYTVFDFKEERIDFAEAIRKN